MLKLMNSVIMLVIFCGAIQSSHGQKLNCDFQVRSVFHAGSRYYCYVTSLDNSFNDMIIDGFIGKHMASKNDNDVKGIWIVNTNMKYIPPNLGILFNLTALVIDKSQLIEIKLVDFQGMKDLDYLLIDSNKLTSVPSDAFSTLTKLKYISLASNQIKYIGSGAFDHLYYLYEVYLVSNTCVNKNYEGISAVIQMKIDTKIKCNNPNEIPATTTQNPMEVELNSLRSELLAAKEALQKLSLELKNLQTKHELKTQELMSKISDAIEPSSEELICEFKDELYNILGSLYTCDVTFFENQCMNKILTGHNGVHQVNRNVENVKAIYIFNTNTTHIPKGLGSLFNLTAFQMFNTQLMEITTKDFKDMKNLEYLNFDYNKLTSVPLDVLKMFTKLKYISLQSNKISELSTGLFANNLELVEVYIDRNRIQMIGSGLFNGLTRLTRVYLTGNKCVDKDYEGSTDMVQLREDVELNCKKPVTDDTVVV